MASELHGVIGAGPLGLATARAALAAGHRVRLVCRSGQAPGAPEGAERCAADAQDSAALCAALAGADVLHHCAGAPYPLWPQRLPGMMDAILLAAERLGARLTYGDNLYLYGPVDRPMTEDLPPRPVGAKGTVRALLAEKLLTAHRAGRVRAAIARAPDFFGPHVERSMLGLAAFRAARRGGTVSLIGDPDQPHSLCFIEDFGRALVTLGGDDRAWGAVWHVPCAPAESLRAVLTRVSRAGGRPIRLRSAGPLLLRLLGLFSRDLRELREVSYQFDRPFLVEDRRFTSTFGWSATDLDTAIARTFAWLDRPSG